MWKTPIGSITFSKSIFLKVSLVHRIWNSGVRKPSYALWRQKTELSQIVTS